MNYYEKICDDVARMQADGFTVTGILVSEGLAHWMREHVHSDAEGYLLRIEMGGAFRLITVPSMDTGDWLVVGDDAITVAAQLQGDLARELERINELMQKYTYPNTRGWSTGTTTNGTWSSPNTANNVWTQNATTSDPQSIPSFESQTAFERRTGGSIIPNWLKMEFDEKAQPNFTGLRGLLNKSNKKTGRGW